MEASNCGSKICDVGIVRSLFKDNTFTFEDCFQEIYQNSDDAGASYLTISIIDYDGKKWLVFEDDGCGMTLEIINNSLYLLHRSNDVVKKHGKFNFGGKASLLYLSGIKNPDENYIGNIIVYSKSDSENEVCYIMKGKDIYNNGWTNSVKPQYLHDNENMIVDNMKNIHSYEKGTKIYIQLTDDIFNDLTNSLENIINYLNLHCYERLNHCSIKFKTNQESEINIHYCDPLNYSNIIDQKKTNFILNCYKKGNSILFIFNKNNKNLGYKPYGTAKCCTDIEEITNEYLQDFEYIGTINYIISCDYKYGDKKKENNNKIYVSRSGFIINEYKGLLNKQQNQGTYYHRIIASKITSMLKYDSNDILDDIIKVNMHKSDIKYSNLPKSLKNTLKYIQETFWKDICKYVDVNEVPSTSPTPLPPSPDPPSPDPPSPDPPSPDPPSPDPPSPDPPTPSPDPPSPDPPSPDPPTPSPDPPSPTPSPTPPSTINLQTILNSITELYNKLEDSDDVPDNDLLIIYDCICDYLQ